MELILASNSPRRKELLKKFGYSFSVLPSDYREIVKDLSPQEMVMEFAFGKASDVFNKLSKAQQSKSVVLGADTIVCLDGKVLGKPLGNEHATEMLKALSGKEHYVYTGYCLIKRGEVVKDYLRSSVVFNDLSNESILEYVSTGKPLDKAGAYGIQDGFNLIKNYIGSFNNIVGLPIEVIKPTLDRMLKD